MKHDRLRRAAAAVLVLALSGCATIPELAPAAKPVDAPALNAGSALQASRDAAWPEQAWWQAYGDPQLDALVADAVAGNPGLRGAQARIEQAQGYTAVAQAATRPKLEGQGRFTRSYSTQEEFSPSLIGAHTFWENSALLRASYDLDLWGRDEQALASALDSAHAAEAEAQAVRLSLVTAVVQAYVQLSAQHALREVTQANLERQQQLLDIARRRLRAGLGTQLEVSQAATVLPETQAQLEAIDERIALQRHQLAALAGKGPGDGDAITRPALRLDHPAAIPEALPASLLGRRPDVVAQRWRVEAAAKDIEVAKARFYPDINIAAFAGIASLNFSTLLTGNALTAGFGPAISLPIFEGGRLRGNLRVQAAGYDMAVESYNAAVIAALREVADQVVSLRSIAAQIERTDAALASARLADDQARQGFRAGLTDYLNVLNAQTGLLIQQRNRAQLVARQLESHALLMKALGGGAQAAAPAAAPGAAR
ncbi:MAG: efflux transporter outer membrane subunit [Nevskia sp.]